MYNQNENDQIPATKIFNLKDKGGKNNQSLMDEDLNDKRLKREIYDTNTTRDITTIEEETTYFYYILPKILYENRGKKHLEIDEDLFVGPFDEILVTSNLTDIIDPIRESSLYLGPDVDFPEELKEKARNFSDRFVSLL